MNKKNLYIYRLLNFRLSLIDFYLINELSYFFLFSVGLFSSLGVALSTISDLAYKITEYNLPINIAIKVFCLKLPEFIAYALPISMLLTTLVTYVRLSHDSELIACRSVGISIYRLVFPALILSLIVTGITFVFNEIVVPAANYQATVIQEPFIPETSFSLQRKDIYYPEYEMCIRDSITAVPSINSGDWQPLIDALPNFRKGADAPKPTTIEMNERKIRVFLPGLDKKQVKLTQYGPEVTIEAGDQRRNVTLPPAWSGRSVTGAKFQNGYLELTIG